MKHLSKSNTFQHNFHQYYTYYTFPRVQETQKINLEVPKIFPNKLHWTLLKLFSRGHPDSHLPGWGSSIRACFELIQKAQCLVRSKVWMMSSLVIWRKNEWSVESIGPKSLKKILRICALKITVTTQDLTITPASVSHCQWDWHPR